jgi:predicted amidohydrolase
MDNLFNNDLLKQWCELYVRFVSKDRQRLAESVNCCTSKQLQNHLQPKQPNIKALLTKSQYCDDDYLAAYGILHDWDRRFLQQPHPHLLSGYIEQMLNQSRYLLVRQSHHPIANAIPEKQRFKSNHTLGTQGILKLSHHWQEIELSTELQISRSDVFDTLSSKKQLKIGLSPYANQKDMNWNHDANDTRGLDNSIPFWCSGAKNTDELQERIISVLSDAHQHGVHILIFPELVMTETLQTAISQWLLQNNAFNRVIHLVIAGTCHVFENQENNHYSNRCTAFNHMGTIEWQQDKRQPFTLTAYETQAFFNVNSPAFEPTQPANHLVIRHTALGKVATPICLDFLCDGLWKAMPIELFLVPAMSPNLSRFKDNCRIAGNEHSSAVFICNTQGNKEPLVVYRPEKHDTLQIQKINPLSFIVDVDITMNPA